MFPAIRIDITGLDPAAYYCIALEMVPVLNCRYKYTASGGWTPVGSEEVQSQQRFYLHPQSPASGEQWMSQTVSFSKLKLTNTPHAAFGHIVLNSMHKYQPKIIVTKTADPRLYLYSPSVEVEFKDTSFIAVTAYQVNITFFKILVVYKNCYHCGLIVSK